MVGSKLKTNDLFEVAEVDAKAFGAGIGLAILMGIFIGFSICLMIWTNRVLSVIVSQHDYY